MLARASRSSLLFRWVASCSSSINLLNFHTSSAQHTRCKSPSAYHLASLSCSRCPCDLPTPTFCARFSLSTSCFPSTSDLGGLTRCLQFTYTLFTNTTHNNARCLSKLKLPLLLSLSRKRSALALPQPNLVLIVPIARYH